MLVLVVLVERVVAFEKEEVTSILSTRFIVVPCASTKLPTGEEAPENVDVCLLFVLLLSSLSVGHFNVLESIQIPPLTFVLMSLKEHP